MATQRHSNVLLRQTPNLSFDLAEAAATRIYAEPTYVQSLTHDIRISENKHPLRIAAGAAAWVCPRRSSRQSPRSLRNNGDERKG